MELRLNLGWILRLKPSVVCCCVVWYVGASVFQELPPIFLQDDNEMLCSENESCALVRKMCNCCLDSQKAAESWCSLGLRPEPGKSSPHLPCFCIILCSWAMGLLCCCAAGLLCHLDDACTSNPCHADAICDTSPINGSYTCSCASGYKGVDCSEDINECEQGSPCEHDGDCVNTPGSFACNCTQGFTGPRCETNVNECESHPCQNDGSCLDDPGTFRCVCMPGE